MQQVIKTRKAQMNPLTTMIEAMMQESVPKSTSRPYTNIIEAEDSYIIEMAVPGRHKESFSIQLDKDQLIISAKEVHNQGDQESSNKVLHSEFALTEFRRTFHISEEIDRDKIDANYEHGVLRISLGKKEAAKQPLPKTIDIK